MNKSATYKNQTISNCGIPNAMQMVYMWSNIITYTITSSFILKYKIHWQQKTTCKNCSQKKWQQGGIDESNTYGARKIRGT